MSEQPQGEGLVDLDGGRAALLLAQSEQVAKDAQQILDGAGEHRCTAPCRASSMRPRTDSRGAIASRSDVSIATSSAPLSLGDEDDTRASTELSAADKSSVVDSIVSVVADGGGIESNACLSPSWMRSALIDSTSKASTKRSL